MSSGCTTINYSKECALDLRIVGLTQDELDQLPRHKQFKSEWNDSLLKEACPKGE